MNAYVFKLKSSGRALVLIVYLFASQALFWADSALRECPPSSLTTLARFHYRRGKILQGMIFSEIRNQSGVARVISSIVLRHDLEQIAE